MSLPLVSIVIPVWNSERYLAETIESALAQTQPPSEILVIDDGSADASREIALRYAPAVSMHPNVGKGPSAARNHGSRLARGDFFQYLDADDLLEPHAIASRVDAMARAGADVAVSDWQRLVESGQGWDEGRVESGAVNGASGRVDVAVLRGFWAPPAAVLYRREVWERSPWRDTLPVIQDARFLLDAGRTGGAFVHVAGVGAKYRQHRMGSLSTSGDARFWRDALQNAREVEALWAETRPLDAAERAALADVYANCARAGFAHEQDLFRDSRSELARFPEFTLPTFLQAAFGLVALTGYGTARRLLAPFSR